MVDYKYSISVLRACAEVALRVNHSTIYQPWFKDIRYPVRLLKIFHLPLNFEIPVSFTCWLVAKTVGISKFSYKRKIFNNWTGKLLSLKFIFATGGWGILNKVQKTLFAFWLETNVMIMIEEWWQSEKQKIGPWKKR